MDKQQLRQKIKELGPWYQNITLDGIKTLRKRDTEAAWKRINENFPMDYKGKRILDLGCNAGYYSIMAAKEGSSVIGIEALERAFNQANFLKQYYNELWNTDLDVTFIHKDLSDVDFLSMGKFDCIFAFAILYHVGNFKYGKGTPASFKEQDRVIGQLVQLTDKFIVRARNRRRNNREFYDPSYYNKVFSKFGFKPAKTINEHVEGRSLVSYERS